MRNATFTPLKGSYYSAMFLLVFVLCTSVSSVKAQWITTSFPTASPYGMHVTKSGNLLVGDYNPDRNGSIYVSTDQANTWVKAEIAGYNFTCFCEAGDYIFAGGTEGHIARTADEGKTWEILRCDQLFEGEITDCYAMAYHHNKLYAAIFGGGVVYSEDFGQKWILTDTESLFEKENVEGIFTYAMASYKDNLYILGAAGIWKLSEQDDTWEFVKETPFISSTFILNGKLFVGHSVYGAPSPFEYTEDMIEWTKVDLPEGVEYVRSSAASKGDIYIGTADRGVYYSADEGKNWHELSEGFPVLMSRPGFPSIYVIPLAFGFLDEDVYSSAFNPGGEGGVVKIKRPTVSIQQASADPNTSIYADAEYLYLNAEATVQITDICGKKISNGNYTEKVNIQHLPNGIYIYSALINGETISGKFIRK